MRYITGCWLLLLLAAAHGSVLQSANNLATESRQAGLDQKIYLLYISRPDCPYCARLEKDVLQPLLAGREFDHQLVLRELSMEQAQLIDFDGRPSSGQKLMAQYQVDGAPTLLFFDSQGNELSERLNGYFSTDYFWYYFIERIGQASLKLSGPAQSGSE